MMLVIRTYFAVGFAIIIVALAAWITICIRSISGYEIATWANGIYDQYDPSRNEMTARTIDTTDCLWCGTLRNNHYTIRDEFVAYAKHHTMVNHIEEDGNRMLSPKEIPWDVVVLRNYGINTNKVQYFPATYALLEQIPGATSIMFSVMKAGIHLKEHRGVYKGVLRYHLGLLVPTNYEDCWIKIAGEKFNWQVGADLMFDDTLLHEVVNDTEEDRVVLFLDIKKDFQNIYLNMFNELFLYVARFNYLVQRTVDKANAAH